MSEKHELSQPPSYEEAVRGNNSYAGASAPCMPSPHNEQQMVPVPHMVPPAQVPLPPPGNQAPVPMFVVPTTTVYVPVLGSNPATLTCPSCHKNIRTTSTTSHTCCAHVICLLMCMLGCFCCSCLPYCLSGYKVTKHECPSCKTFLGEYRP